MSKRTAPSDDLARKSSRGGARVGAGRKPVLDGAEAYKVNLDAETVAQLRELGDGNLSAGVRAAAQTVAARRPAVEAPSEAVSSGGLARLDPRLVDVSRYSGRHPDAFADSAFLRLKDAIAHASGNLVPVLVRQAAEGRYELAYGRRRLQACLELGLPVQAVVADLLDHDLVMAMLSEAVDDESWSAYERGATLNRLLEAGLYPSMRRLAETVHWPLGEVGACLTLFRLPQAAIDAFASPRDMKLAWASKLGAAAMTDSSGLAARAAAISAGSARLSAAKVFAELMNGKSS